MPFYTVEQKGVPGIRLVEAPRADSALKHVVEDAFTVVQVDGRALLDAAKAVNNNIEIAGAPRESVEPPKGPADASGGSPGVDLNDEPRVDPEQAEVIEEDDRPLHERMAAQMSEQDDD